MKTALLSVYNKDGIVEFAKELVALDFKIYASGGTAKILSAAGIEVTDIASLVGGGPILGHRVVTLSREIHAGLLAQDNDDDRNELKKLNIPWIDLVCIDLYPLQSAIEEVKSEQLKVESAREKVIEKTDMGGPAALRSAAKGRRIVVCDPADRLRVVDWLKNGEPEKDTFLNDLAAKAEFTVANYALASARYHSKGKYDGIILSESLECKYGENAWQTPAKLLVGDHSPLSLSEFKLTAGTAPSYNNLADVDRLLQTMTHLAAGLDVNNIDLSPNPSPAPGEGNPKRYIAIGVKHGNPCGAAVDDNPHRVLQKMLEGDLRAIFGGLVMVNFTVDEVAAEILLSYQMPENQRRLLDGIIAPEFSAAAVEMLKRKGDKCRFLVNPALASLSKSSLDEHFRFRYVRGGFLMQPNYNFVLDLKNSELEASGELSDAQKQDIILAWAVGSTSNSNTVSIAKDGQLIGNGVGQQDRVSVCELAIKRATDAKHDVSGAVAYSDSFFPFPDGPQKLIDAGIKTIFATRGSVKDEEVKKVCMDNGVSFITLPDTAARGFFNH